MTITCVYDTSESIANNRGRKRGQGGHTIRGSHQECGVQYGRFNLPVYTSSIRNFNEEVDDFIAVLGTTAEQREAKDQYRKFSENLKQYILR